MHITFSGDRNTKLTEEQRAVSITGYVGLNRPDVVDSLNSVVQQLLQQHVRVSRPDDVMHYSRLLMCLPSLYGISSKMVERLFCRHINRNTDMEVLLKELLQNL
ncbi:hypothetical protein C0Q70_03775 [Pomacea canaliculata]|uniref:NR LBD domain-containing protein n=1 Tax=Pomacea canaliculata TaxID=400727 RepID=A0A2T7PTN3_POMCA|nr:hypothetical protein C0Q70_03775 [Pomacea canaliculata]